MTETVEISRGLYLLLVFGPPAAIWIGATLALLHSVGDSRSSRKA